MEFDITSLTGYGAMGICLAYFIYKDLTVSKQQSETNTQVRDTMHNLKEVVAVLIEVIKK